ncbi:hypothetical protein CCACVL1_14372 [Corchorus capsularis]|uniref:CDT1 Geminin-binding domain-containing protein n=1 Tax=Corchorus capsularis TaxID=210143 RepID=A0A1R3I7C1_COCAP|nr:hypothetical protein CCACVL1_14372 [Corchorus capsularis]
MNSSDSLESTPLKSKKSLSLASNSPVSKTPEKHGSLLPNRPRNSGVALSIKEIRQVAQARPKPPTDEIESARKQILFSPNESPPPKTSGDRPKKLTEKYEMLCEFFNSLDSALRLLKLRGSVPTFRNISSTIECLTKRRFSYGHLAQLKHILPEAIQIKKMLVLDERTSCMKPDLHIRIIVNAIECGDKSKSETKNLNLRRVFRSRLSDFVKAHPEDAEIPEEDLPEPFNHSKQKQQLNMIKAQLSSDESSTNLTREGEAAESVNEQQPVVASHLPLSFQKRFSKRVASKAQDTVQHSSNVSLQSSNVQVPELSADIFASSGKTSSAPSQSPTEVLCKPASSEMSFKTCLPATPVKEILPLKTEDGSPTKAGGTLSTPAKLASTPARLMTATPTLQPQKRCYMSPDEVSLDSSNKLLRRPPRTRSLKFDTPVKEKKVVGEDEMAIKPVDDDEDDILSVLPESLLNSIKEKERKAMEELDPAISQAKRRQRMIACLPKLFNTIHYLFQSIRRSVITKEELVHKIIAGHCDIIDRGEVEEQLKLLQELAPEWISEKRAFAGDLLVCVNKVSSAESIRVRLQEAK